ncbi:zinc finger protein 3-like [Rana temporaria]|uniref:zinc finger protein 3-like n=1 Tax=Rana temporaria TaxID=8407 RepID=UPI001AACCC61|nr:zinc finger protein 3-like [Rana temporaria]XP_040177606.1 zinc finger protein 3-like [Rana temporaria]
MDKERKKRTESILNLTLEIIYLLTGEDYKVVKKTSWEYVTDSNLSCSSREWVKRQSAVMESSPASMITEKNKDKKILGVINKIIELLTGEVPSRCQDVTVFASMKECLEGPEDLYKDVMMENRPPLTSPDGSSKRNSPERRPRPLYSEDSTHTGTRATQTDVRVQDKEGDLRIKEEDVPLEISTDGRYKACATQKRPLISVPGASNDDFPIDSIEQNPIIPNVSSVLRFANLSPDPHGGSFSDQSRAAAHRSACDTLVTDDKMEEDEEEEEEVHVMIKEENTSPGISTGGETEDDGIAPSSSKENLDHPVLHSADPSSDSSTFSRLPDLPDSINRRKGAKTYVCSDCGQSFPERIELVIHRKCHKVEKPYACPECGKCYSQRALLNRHQKAHSGVKPYSCPVCGKAFSQSQYLVLHQRSHTGEKPYACLECGKCFFRSDHLIRHKRFHTGEKPYSCAECGKCFAVRFCLTEHERIHTGERPYSCTECGRGFTSRSNLASHARVHTGHHPYSCSECGKRFSKKSYLMTHLSSHGGQEAPISEFDT